MARSGLRGHDSEHDIGDQVHRQISTTDYAAFALLPLFRCAWLRRVTAEEIG